MPECWSAYLRTSTRGAAVGRWERLPAMVARPPDHDAAGPCTPASRRRGWLRAAWVRAPSRSGLGIRRGSLAELLGSGLLILFIWSGRSGCAPLLFFLLPGLARHFFLLSRLVIVEFRHGLSVGSKAGPLTVAIPGSAVAERKLE